ncbi:alginate export family protein [Rubripirellula amarantea]|nr:alginate export family protein [Rubripirellula amarantea]
MFASNQKRRRVLALSIASSLFCLPAALADSPQSQQELVELHVSELVQQVVDYAPLQDSVLDASGASAELAETPQLSEMPDTAAMPDPMPMHQYADPTYTATPCQCCNSTCCTKEKKDAATAKMKGAYKGVFYANDFSHLNDKCYDGPEFCGDSLKGLLNGKLDLGGEARVRYHSENNHRGLGLTGRDDEFWLTRLRFFSNYRINKYFRVYGEYLYADSGGEFFNNRPIEENRGEIQNLFLDTNLTESLSVRVGRQELLFGEQRLVSPLDWGNTRRTFQGVRGTYQGDDWTVDGFFTNPVNRNAANESKIDDAEEDIDFFGVYASTSKFDVGTVDAYYLGLTNDILDFDYHTIGSRVGGKSDGGLLYEVEGGVQFGSNSPGYGSHSAGFFTGGLGRQLNVANDWKPTVWAWYDWASGGDDVPAARGDNSFDHLFPLAHKYNGFMDLFGRRNLHDVNFQFITPFMGPKVKMILWYHHFFLDQATTPYGVTMQPYNANNAARDKELGQEIDVLFNVDLNPRNNVLIGYSHFNAGEYFKTTPGVQSSDDADFFYFQYQTRF